ncbi:hypothetical protein BGW41_004458 [Actinomortierella wolfii]|nr:hypothetical protein BGW41_004458 [Actinomortierella wolfii]
MTSNAEDKAVATCSTVEQQHNTAYETAQASSPVQAPTQAQTLTTNAIEVACTPAYRKESDDLSLFRDDQQQEQHPIEQEEKEKPLHSSPEAESMVSKTTTLPKDWSQETASITRLMKLVGAPKPQMPAEPPVWVEHPSDPSRLPSTNNGHSTVTADDDDGAGVQPAATAERERRWKEYEALRKEYEETKALLQSAEVVSQGVDAYFQNCVVDHLDAMDEDPFTLESFESLMRTHASRGKDFILARVTTQDPVDAEKRYHSYYGAHQINKVLFRTQPEEGLLHRMKARNPLNNMLIVGDVHYYSISAEQVNKIKPIKGSSGAVKSSAASILSSLSRKSRCSKLAAKAIAEQIGYARSSPLLGGADSDDSALFASSETENSAAATTSDSATPRSRSSVHGRGRHHYRSNSGSSLVSQSSNISLSCNRARTAPAAITGSTTSRPSRLRQAIQVGICTDLSDADTMEAAMSPTRPFHVESPDQAANSDSMSSVPQSSASSNQPASLSFPQALVRRMHARRGSVDSSLSDSSHFSHVSGCSTATQQSTCSNISHTAECQRQHGRSQHSQEENGHDQRTWQQSRAEEDGVRRRDIDSDHEQRSEDEKHSEERVVYTFKYLATDDDYLLKASVRQVFKLNALEPWDAVLFTISSNALYDYTAVPHPPPTPSSPLPPPSQPEAGATSTPLVVTVSPATHATDPSLPLPPRSAATATPVTPRSSATAATPRRSTSFTSLGGLLQGSPVVPRRDDSTPTGRRATELNQGTTAVVAAAAATVATAITSSSLSVPEVEQPLNSPRSIMSRVGLISAGLGSPRGSGNGGFISRNSSRNFGSRLSIDAPRRGGGEENGALIDTGRLDYNDGHDSISLPLTPPPPLPAATEMLPPLDVMPVMTPRHSGEVGMREPPQPHVQSIRPSPPSSSSLPSSTSSAANSQESLLNHNRPQHRPNGTIGGDERDAADSLSGTIWSPRTRARMESQQQHSLAMARAHAQTRALLNERRAAQASAVHREIELREDGDYDNADDDGVIRSRSRQARASGSTASRSRGPWWSTLLAVKRLLRGRQRHNRDHPHPRLQGLDNEDDDDHYHMEHVSSTATAGAGVTTRRHRSHQLPPAGAIALHDGASDIPVTAINTMHERSQPSFLPSSRSLVTLSSLSNAHTSRRSLVHRIWKFIAYPPVIIGSYALVGIVIVHLVSWPMFAAIMAGLLLACALVIYFGGHRHALLPSIEDVRPLGSSVSTAPSWMGTVNRGSNDRVVTTATFVAGRENSLVPREAVQQTNIVPEFESNGVRSSDNDANYSVGRAAMEVQAVTEFSGESSLHDLSMDDLTQRDTNSLSSRETAESNESEHYHGAYMHMRLRCRQQSISSSRRDSNGGSVVEQPPDCSIESDITTTDDDDDVQSMVSAMSNISSSDVDPQDQRHQKRQLQQIAQSSKTTMALPHAGSSERDVGENSTFATEEQPNSRECHRREMSSPLLERMFVAAQLESCLAMASSDDHESLKATEVAPTATTTAAPAAAAVIQQAGTATTATPSTMPLTPVTPLTPRTLRARSSDLEQGQATAHC